MRRRRRELLREIARAGIPGAEGPGDQIVRRTLIPSATSGVAVRLNSGTPTAAEPQLNLIEGAGIDITVADDPGTPEVDITIASTITQAVTVRKNSGSAVGPRTQLNFIEGTGISITVADDAGTPEVDITLATNNNVFVFPHRLIMVERAGLTPSGFDTFGTGAHTETGTASAQNDTTGGYVRYSNATVGGASGWLSVGSIIRRRYIPKGYFIVKQQITQAPLRTWVGFTTTSLQTVTTPTTQHVAAFRYEPGTDTTWKAITCDGASNVSTTNTLVTVTDDTRVKFGIEMDGSQVLFYIDDVLKATHGSNLPGIDTSLNGYAANTRNAGTVLFDIARMYFTTEL